MAPSSELGGGCTPFCQCGLHILSWVTCVSSHHRAQSFLSAGAMSCFFSLLEQDTVFYSVRLVFEEWIFSLKTMFHKLFKAQFSVRNIFYIMTQFTQTHTHTPTETEVSRNNTYYVGCALIFSLLLLCLSFFLSAYWGLRWKATVLKYKEKLVKLK